MIGCASRSARDDEGEDEPEEGEDSALRLVASAVEILRSKSFAYLNEDERQRVAKLIELSTRDDELGFAQADLVGSSSCLEVALAARLAAELARPAGSGRLIDRSPAPLAPIRFRHQHNSW